MEITIVDTLNANIKDRTIQVPVFHMQPAKYSSNYAASNETINTNGNMGRERIAQNSLNIQQFFIALLKSEIMGFKQPK